MAKRHAHPKKDTLDLGCGFKVKKVLTYIDDQRDGDYHRNKILG